MRQIEWDPAMDTGNELVDEQHRGLVALFNELITAEVDSSTDVSVPEVLERLTEYVLVHFSAEEDMMDRVGYSGAERTAHLDEHQQLTERTREMVLDYRSGKISSPLPIVDVLYQWLGEHVGKRDRRLVDFVRQAS